MKLQAFIKKYGISHVIIARELGISRGTFSLKLREIHGQRLTEEQQEKVRKFILQIIEDANLILGQELLKAAEPKALIAAIYNAIIMVNTHSEPDSLGCSRQELTYDLNSIIQAFQKIA